jgi:uncharacterized protein YndB with AHSA1/START domain
MSIWMWIVICGSLAVAAAVFLTPRRVSYAEETIIAASPDAVYDHIRLQQRLMRWSAWPSETGSSCTCEGEDGQVGARTVFFGKDGKRFGHQEIVSLDPGRRVDLVLDSKGPPQKPRISFELTPVEAGSTRVVLRFDNVITPPFNLILQLVGIVRWTRAMHVKDLQGLKRYAEPPHQTYAGEPATELMAA